MQNKNDVKPIEIFEKMTEDLNYDLFWGPKWPGNRACEANIQHTYKRSSDWHAP